MSDIFISYSRRDSEQANLLAEMLSSAGLSCWIDQHGIEAASSWSAQIVDAINDCKVLIALLSSTSIESHNVIKEISLASEKRKKILPLDLEELTLPRELEYQLAGIQRAPISNIDSIIRALGKLGLEATGAPQVPKIVKAKSDKKSLMVLPFQDLSPTADNGWFADGIANELISALSNIKVLRVSNQQATIEYKRYTGTLPVYAREMQIQYFVQGDVRKFGDQIKISVSLLEIETGDHLWHDAMKGTMQDIFEIQEKVAEKVVEGLKIHLASDEKKKLAARETENAEAYELRLKGEEYLAGRTKESMQHAVQLYSEAIRLDPSYAQAYASKANTLSLLYRNYDRDPMLLEQALELIQEARRLKPDLWSVNAALSVILMMQDKLAEAEQAAQEYVRNAGQELGSHFALGFFYAETGQPELAIAPFEEALRLKPDHLSVLFNLVLACAKSKEEAKQKQWALVAIPYFEKHVKLFPDEENRRVGHATLLRLAGLDDDAIVAARRLDNLRDGNSLYNIACLHCDLKDYSSGVAVFRKAIEMGFRHIILLKSFLDNELEGIGTLKGTAEWESVRELVEKLEAELQRNSNNSTNPSV